MQVAAPRESRAAGGGLGWRTKDGRGWCHDRKVGAIPGTVILVESIENRRCYQRLTNLSPEREHKVSPAERRKSDPEGPPFPALSKAPRLAVARIPNVRVRMSEAHNSDAERRAAMPMAARTTTVIRPLIETRGFMVSPLPETRASIGPASAIESPALHRNEGDANERQTYPKNTPDDFYLENDCCITCEAPYNEAPDLMAHDEIGDYPHCDSQARNPR
ncbi:hypothetical protein SAMN05444166_1083 [Singulisphaera sp. GP187]|nr:hypothetical protein SAMN05444166_1083 [Singulisphaera sp. GP187]